MAENRVRDLNDAFRRAGPVRGDWVVSHSVAALGVEFIGLATEIVRAFATFTAGDDPYGERDFGSFCLAGENLFWKIDYYDQTLSSGSEDPADATLTRRVMTIMLASDY